MEIALAGLTFETCLCYLDDVIVFGRDFDEHNSWLRTVLKRFRKFNLKVKLSNCVFAARQVCYLGHVILQQDVAQILQKLMQHKIYHHQVTSNNCAVFLAPLTQLTRKEYQNKFSWTEECNKSFRILKDLLCTDLPVRVLSLIMSYDSFAPDQ